jgi:hypothetical protein
MKLIIPLLSILLVITGCAGKTDRTERCTHYSAIYEAYLTTTTLRPVSKEEAAAAAVAAVFLRTYCGWSGPKAGSMTDVEDANGVPNVFPPDGYYAPEARTGAARTGIALRADPIPIGPPAAGRLISLPLFWDHNPALDGSTFYRLYWGRTANQWDGAIVIQTNVVQPFIWQTSASGPVKFTITSVRPPIVSNGETNSVESDPSNILQLQLAGPPVPPGRLRNK